jgi:hypothetical protein
MTRSMRISARAAAVFACVALGAACGSSGSKGATPVQKVGSTTTQAPTTTEAPKPYDPTKPINLCCEPGYTKAEQTRAETLLRATLKDLPQFSSVAVAEADGYRSIGDALTGDEHFVNWSYVNDGKILDPKKPESIVFQVRGGKKTAVAAMYMLPFGSKFKDVPDVGGALTQWHVHRDLCLTDNPMQKIVSGLTTVDGTCPPGTEKAGDTPMLHVWIIPNQCGPFAALEGIGAGQVPKGQTRLCDTGHGSTTT